MNGELLWIENDFKVEQLAIRMKKLRKKFISNKPDASEEQIEKHIERKLDNTAQIILNEQFDIISSALN